MVSSRRIKRSATHSSDHGRMKKRTSVMFTATAASVLYSMLPALNGTKQLRGATSIATNLNGRRDPTRYNLVIWAQVSGAPSGCIKHQHAEYYTRATVYIYRLYGKHSAPPFVLILSNYYTTPAGELYFLSALVVCFGRPGRFQESRPYQSPSLMVK